MEWDRGTTLSAIGHAGLILWVALGDWLFAPNDAPEMQVAEVSLISEADYQAMMASAPKPAEPAEQPAEPAPQPPQVEA
ncbi:MAG: cell envelope biogenesis protein TolA, partial [Rhodobacteraceae bacterium]|nr:cell envelope biogenesis protein TolA [Paracoccaceae bacterium]